MALNGTITGSTANKYIDAKIVWSATQSISGNYSDVTATLYYSRNNTGYTTSGTWSGSISINGAAKSESKKLSISYNSNTAAIANTVRVYHNNDGTKSLTISASGSIASTSLSSTTISGTVSLNTIPRQANLTSAPNFNDEQNPVIKYSNTAGNAVTSLQACISITGEYADIAYRDVSKTGNSYTFNLTEAERKVLRKATNTSNSRIIKFYLKTVINGATYYSSLSKTFSIVNGNPALAPIIEDINPSTLDLTGNKKKIVKYFSNVHVATGAVARKEASLKAQSVTCGTKSINAAKGTLNNVESNVFTFSATDTRGNKVTAKIDKVTEGNFIDYIKLTCNMVNSKPDTQGKFTLSAEGNFFNGSFGAVKNTVSVIYRYKVKDGTFGSWKVMTTSISGNTYTASAEITGLNYKTNYIFQIVAQDKLSSVSTPETPVKVTPVFDWGENDFNFNVPTSYNNQKLMYVAGDSFTLGSEKACMHGFITYYGRYIYITIPTSKPIFADGVSFTGSIIVRGINGYVNGTTFGDSIAINLAGGSGYTISSSINDSGINVGIHFTAAIANATNNTPVVATPYTGDLTVTFN